MYRPSIRFVILFLYLTLGVELGFGQTPLPLGRTMRFWAATSSGASWQHKSSFAASGPGESMLMLHDDNSAAGCALFYDSSAVYRWQVAFPHSIANACISSDHKIWVGGDNKISVYDYLGNALMHLQLPIGDLKYLEADDLGHVYVLAKSNNGFYLGKYNSNGNYLWCRSVPLPLVSSPRRLTLLGDSTLFVTSSPYLVSIDSAGTILQSIEIGPYSEAAIFKDHSFAICHALMDTVLVTRARANGQIVWRKWYRDNHSLVGVRNYPYTGIVADREFGGLLLGGHFQVTTGNPGCGFGSFIWEESWVMRVDSLGNPWQQTRFYGYAGERLNEMHQDGLGYAYISKDVVGTQIPCWSKVFTPECIRTSPSMLTNCITNGLNTYTHGYKTHPASFSMVNLSSAGFTDATPPI